MIDKLNILFLGDIVGRSGRFAVASYLKSISESDKPDFIIANGENASHGFGLTEKNYEELLSYGINCITSGNHIWDKKDIFNYIDSAQNLIRPINYPQGTQGVGSRIFETQKCKIGVVNILGRTFMSPVDSPWAIITEEINKIKQVTPIIIIDFHAEASAEKICFGRYCSELLVSAVIGTHTHVQTADEKIFNDCTAYITDAGFCGDPNGVIGMDYQTSLKRLVTSLPERFDVSSSQQSQVNAVQFAIDVHTGRASDIKRINFIKNNNEVMIMMKG